MSWTPQGPYSTGNNFTSGNANNLETGIGQCVYTDGSHAITGAQDHNQTLSGADKTYLTITASDGKQYALMERNSDKALVIKNVTDGAILLELGPAAGLIKANGQTVWTAANDGAGSTLDADTVDGIQAAGMLQYGSGGQKTGFKVTEGNALPSSGMAKGDVHFLTSFVLP